MAEWIWAMICAVLAIACLIISIMSFRERGFLFNNAFIWASGQERETMNKKPYYRQSSVAFALCAALFVFMELECVLFTGWLWLVVGPARLRCLCIRLRLLQKELTNYSF